jgi:hypothetical protein
MTVDDREKQIEDEDDGEEDCERSQSTGIRPSVEVGYLMKSKENRKEQI